jgi:putative acetyltransferase
MYSRSAALRKGLGGQLNNKCLEFAKGFGYIQVYIETMPELKKAVIIREEILCSELHFCKSL